MSLSAQLESASLNESYASPSAPRPTAPNAAEAPKPKPVAPAILPSASLRAAPQQAAKPVLEPKAWGGVAHLSVRHGSRIFCLILCLLLCL